jgi:hypothetical protein
LGWAERATIIMALANVVDGFEQHAACAARWVVKGLTLARVAHLDNQPHDRTGRVKLDGFLIREMWAKPSARHVAS